MNFLNLKYFIAIAEEQNISSAARRLYVSQQSLSEHLKKMETELGAPLVTRTNPLTLTAAGQICYEGAKQLLASYDHMLANITEVTTDRRSRITIGIPTYCTPPYLAELLSVFARDYPQFDVSVIKRQHNDISHYMQGVDLYLSYLPLDDNLENVILLDPDPYAVLFQRSLAVKVYGDRWSSIERELKETRNLALLDEMPFLILKDRQNQITPDLVSIFEQYHLTPKVGFVSENGELNVDLCIEGTGCLLMPTSYLKKEMLMRDPVLIDDLLLFEITVTGFAPVLAISYEKGKYLHSSEICFIREARAFLTNQNR